METGVFTAVGPERSVLGGIDLVRARHHRDGCLAPPAGQDQAWGLEGIQVAMGGVL